MFVIEAREGNWKWISGVFIEEQDAKQFFDSTPDELKQYQRLYQVPYNKYPVYVIENNEFIFVSKEELINKIKETEINDDEDKIHYNYYIIKEDYCPEEPRTDYMGSLYHVHVTNDFLKRFSVDSDL